MCFPKIGLSSVIAALTVVVAIDSSAVAAQGKGVEDRKCRHILVPSESRADELMMRIEKGESFAKLARRYSFDVVTKPLAGDLGWIAAANYEAEFLKCAYSIKGVNGVAKCRTSHGWHVIQVTEILNPGGRKPAKAQTTGSGNAKPTTQPEKPQPPRSSVNRDIFIALNVLQKAVGIGEAVEVEITLINKSNRPQNVFNPVLWPMGLTARYQFGRLNLPLEFPATDAEPKGGFSRMLEPGRELTERFRLQDYTGDLEPWPIIRMNWRANIFFSNLERRFPAIRGIDGYDKTREQWKYYATREEHRFNVLPEFDSGDRWFVMLHARGRIWVELEDPGVPGLLEHWMDLVRQDTYDRQKFAVFKEGSHINAGGVEEDGSGQTEATFALPAGFTPAEVGPNSLALEVTKGDRGFDVGSRFYLTLDSPQVRGVTIGRVVEGKGTEILDAIASQYEIRGQVPRTMLALAYPYSLLSDDVKSVVDAKPTATASKEPRPRVEFTVGGGAFVIELFEDDAPNSVANFITLTEAGFYNGLTFHHKWRSLDNLGFVQTGSPDGTKMGNAGYHIKDEINRRKHRKGTVALAKKGRTPNSSSSQFYICLEEQPFFDGLDTVIGRVVEGMDVVMKIRKGVKIESTEVVRKRDHDYQVQKFDPSATSKPRR